MRKIISLMLIIFIMCQCAAVCAEPAVTVSAECDYTDVSVPIADTGEPGVFGTRLDIKAKSVILMESRTCEILYEENADLRLAPASITKIMSLLLVMEAIDRKELSLEDVITASAHACSMGGSQIWLEENECMTVDDLLKAAVIASANDATVALGEKVAGSEEGFVALMNKRAKELGMNSTEFKNCTGLDAEGHLTTAHDVALMSAALISHDLIKRYSTVWMDSLRDGKSELVNTNKLVRFYKGTTGLKTGTTSGAGYCLSATAERDNLSLVAVVMGGETSPARFEGAKKLLDYGFANFYYDEILPDLKNNTSVKVLNGTEKTVTAMPDGKLCALLKKSEKSALSQKTVLEKTITAPVKKGQVIGKTELYSGDTFISAVDLLADRDIKKLTFGAAFLWLLKGLCGMR